jgi:hypothetical protein
VAPVAPVAPTSPLAPVAPDGPGSPANPVAPVAPASPASPVSPVSPVKPVAPTAPVSPAGPGAPGRPCTPSAPPGPDCPTRPAGPRTPACPGRPRGPEVGRGLGWQRGRRAGPTRPVKAAGVHDRTEVDRPSATPGVMATIPASHHVQAATASISQRHRRAGRCEPIRLRITITLLLDKQGPQRSRSCPHSRMWSFRTLGRGIATATTAGFARTSRVLWDVAEPSAEGGPGYPRRSGGVRTGSPVRDRIARA